MNFTKIKNNFSDNSDLKYLIKNGKIKLAKSIIVLVLNLLLSWFLGNFYSKDFFGKYQYFLSVIGLFSIFALPGMKEAIAQSVARGYETSLEKGTKSAFRFSLIGSVLLLLIAGYFFYIKNDSISFFIFLFSAVFSPFFYTLDNFFSYLNGKEYFKKDLFCRIIVDGAKLLAIVFSLIIFSENLITLILFFFISQIILYTYYYLKHKKEISSKKFDKTLYRYGLFLTKINVIIVMLSYLDKFLVGLLLGPKTLALYYVGIILPTKIKAIIKPALYVLFPRFSRDQMRLTKNKIYGILVFSALMTLALIIVIPYFNKIFFPKYTYTDVINYGRIYSIMVLFLPINVIFEYFFKAKKGLLAIKNTLIIPKTINIILLFPILYFVGIYGVICLMILEELTTLIINIKYYINNEK